MAAVLRQSSSTHVPRLSYCFLCLTVVRNWSVFFIILMYAINVEVLPITGHEGPEGEYRYSPTLS